MMLLTRLTRLGRRYRHFKRYREIATVLFRHGFGDLLRRMGMHRFQTWGSLRSDEEEGTGFIPTRAERVRMALEELGPAFVKLGQLLSTRPDIVPEPLMHELEKLQDAVPPFPEDQARNIVGGELGRPISDVFASFGETPIASASIAQVHEAVTRDGARVVLKIRRPDIDVVMTTDLEIMSDLAGMLERAVPEAAVFEPVRLVREFGKSLRRELDLAHEASHLERFARCFKDDPRIHIPTIHRSLCTSRMLVMEHMDGIKISNLKELDARGIDRRVVATNGASLMLEQIFTHGFFHADPHPGNLMVLPDNVICFLDCGAMGVLTLRQREQLGDLMMGLAAGDERRVADAVVRLSGFRRRELLPRIEADILAFTEGYMHRPLREIEIGRVMSEVAAILIRYEIHMPPEFFLLTKALTTLEGVGRKLSPDFDVMMAAEPFARKLLRERYSPWRLLQQGFSTAGELNEFIRHAPAELTDLLAQARRGELKVKFEHRGLEGLSKILDQISNRIAFAIVLAALVIGSALMVHSGIPPKLGGIPVIGLLGFCVSGLMAFSLLYSMIKHGRM